MRRPRIADGGQILTLPASRLPTQTALVATPWDATVLGQQ